MYLMSTITIVYAAQDFTTGKREITTRNGKLRGLHIEFTNAKLGPVEAFLGLQYGTTRGGRLRFMPPSSPLENWKGTRVAVSHRPPCPQPIINEREMRGKLPRALVEHFKRLAPFTATQSEECLTLNIYLPVKGK